MEEMEKAEVMRAEREARGSDELQSRIQELDGHLKESERKRMDLIHANMALHNNPNVVRKEKAYLEEAEARRKEKQLSVVCSQVKLEVYGVFDAPDMSEQSMHALIVAGGAVSPTPNFSTHPTPPICCKA